MAARKRTGKLRQYAEEDMHKALLAARGGEPVAAAARRFGVPRVTLLDRLKGRVPDTCKMGRKTFLTNEEESLLVQWILTCRTKGFPISAEELMTSVSHLVKKLNRETPFTGSLPGKKWYKLFMQRHSNELALREAQNLTASRGNITQERLESWFAEVKQYFQENDLLKVLEDPSRVFNCDESAFFLCPKKGKVIVGKGDKSVYNVTGNNERENLTVLLTCCADGTLAPSLVVYPHERLPHPIVKSFPEEWGIGKSETGWMTSELFYEFMANVFEPHLTRTNTKRPVVMFMDGHRSHLTLHLSQFCSSKQIELVALLPNATHILQPLDVAVFHPLKNGWKKGVTKWKMQHNGAKLKKENFAPLLKEVLKDTIKAETIQNGFNACGLRDLNPNKVDMSKLIGNAPRQVRATTNVHEVRGHLMYLEKLIEYESLQLFKAGGPIPEKDESLYRVWKEMNIQANYEEPQADNLQELQPIILATVPAVEHPSDEEDYPTVVEVNENVMLEFDVSDTIELDLPVMNSQNDIDISDTIQFELPVMNSQSNIPDINVQDIFPSPEPGPSSRDQENTPVKTPVTINTPPNVPSPFKSALFWPGSPKSNASKRKKIKTPSVITSKSWKDYHTKIAEEKSKKQKEIAERKAIREAKSKIKKEKEEGKVSKRTKTNYGSSERKKQKVNPQEEEQEEEKEIEEEEEEVDDILAEHLCEDTNNAFDLDNFQGTSAVLPDDVKIGQWVVVVYEETKTLKKKKFIGQVLKKEEGFASVKFLTRKGEKFIWPNLDDIDDVPFRDIILILPEPTFDRWGYLTFGANVSPQE